MKTFEQTVKDYILEDPGYPLEAYEFVRDGLRYTNENPPQEIADDKYARERAAGSPILSARSLCFGLRDFALDEFGPMALFTLSKWNINSTTDFGALVANLVKMGILLQDRRDSIKEFDNVFDFQKELGLY